MGLIDRVKSFFGPAWYQKDEWAKVDTSIVHVVTDVHDCPSWDVEVRYCETYRHKDRCEERVRLGLHKDLGETHTTFEDPTDRVMEWQSFSGSFESEPLNEDKLYEQKS